MHDLFANSFAEQNHEQHQQKKQIQLELQLKLDDEISDEHTVDILLPTTSTPTETNNTLNLICVNETVCAEGNAFATQFYPHSEYYDYVDGDFSPAAGQKNNKTHTSAATRSHQLLERQQSAHEFTGASLRRQQRTAYLKEDQWPI